MQIEAQKKTAEVITDFITKRSASLEIFPLHETAFTQNRCRPFHAGLRDCALQQPTWPSELVRTNHCNRLLYVVNSTYFQPLKSTVVPETASAPRNISKSTPTDTTMVDSNTTVTETCHVLELSYMNILCLCIGMIIGLLLYIVIIKVYQQIDLLRDCTKPMGKQYPSPMISSAFYYVATMPITTKRSATFTANVSLTQLADQEATTV